VDVKWLGVERRGTVNVGFLVVAWRFVERSSFTELVVEWFLLRRLL
jgi:hypothetical protein